MRIPRLRRASVALLTGGLVAGLVLAAPTGPVGAASSSVTTALEPLDIVVLGDSYSAGNGATNDAGEPETYGPENCFRSRVAWAEKYAAGLRERGRPVNLVNHACSGGKAADFIAPRVMDTASRSTSNSENVTTLEEATAFLERQDLCNTQEFPAEEFWTYQATRVDESTIDYDCTRKLRPQAKFITAETDLVLFTMGGNDAGFTNIVTQCFILKSGSGCQETIDMARALLPEIRQRLLDGVAGIREAGLREDAKIVQLGYPYLQTDNDYMVVGVPPYPAGDEVRSLIDDGTAALAGIPAAANVNHPGQMAFLPGIKEAFAGHEPDATTPIGNVDRWVNQVGDGSNTSFWYHPNGLGQTAYATVLLEATPRSPEEPDAPVRTTLRAVLAKRTVEAGEVVRVRTRVLRSDGSRPRGRVLVRVVGKKVADKARVSADGRNVLRLKGLRPGQRRLKVVHVHRGARIVVFRTVVVRRR